MKWIHLADLHIGRHHEAADLSADQEAVLQEILDIVRTEQPDGVLIAGDVYDRSLPPEWAVKMLDDFLTQLAAMCPVYMISGNHDSGSRLAFAATILSRQGMHVSGSYSGQLVPIQQGDTDIYLLPYLHPVEVRRVLQRDDITTMQQAVQAVLDTAVPGTGRRKILLAHLFATSAHQEPEHSDSENLTVGGVDSVDVSVFDGYDYVALGHIHGPQQVGRETIRYAGTPLMYSFSEAHHVKSVCVVDLESETPIRLIPLTAGRKMRKITGTLKELLNPAFDTGDHNDILLAELTDPHPQIDAATQLNSLYPTVMVRYINLDASHMPQATLDIPSFSDPMQLLEAFYTERTGGTSMTEQEHALLSELMERAQKGGR